MTVLPPDANGLLNLSDVPPKHYLIGLLSAFSNHFQTFADASLEEITWKQLFALICIIQSKFQLSITQLAEIIETSHQNAKQILLRLEKKGYIRLITDPSDRRRQLIELTKKGKSSGEKVKAKTEFFMEHLYAGLSDKDVQTTIETIIQMEKNLNTY